MGFHPYLLPRFMVCGKLNVPLYAGYRSNCDSIQSNPRDTDALSACFFQAGHDFLRCQNAHLVHRLANGSDSGEDQFAPALGVIAAYPQIFRDPQLALLQSLQR